MDQNAPPAWEKQQRRRTDRRAASRRPRGLLLVMVVVSGLAVIAILAGRGMTDRSLETSFAVVTDLLHRHRLDPGSLEFVEAEHVFRGKILRPAGEQGARRFELRLGDRMDEQVFAQFQKYNEQFRDDTSRKVWPRPARSTAGAVNAFITLLPWVVFALVLYFLFFRHLRQSGAGGSFLTFGRSRARLATRDSSRITFADVAGIKEAKGDVQEVIEFLRNPARFQKLGGRIPRGILLVGSPGTGKTLLAKAIAGEADVPFFSICGSDFVEMFVGVGASRVRDLFKQARDSSPCIIFLDEVDAVGRRRGSGVAGGHDEREQTLNAILVEMDGFNSDEGIIVIAATNRPDVLDPALLRPGRFDREIVIDLPDLNGREEILRVHSRKVRLDGSVDLRRIARGTSTFSGAELAALVNEAAIIAAMNDQPAIRESEMEEARDKIRWGRQKTSRVLSDEDRRITAYHEAGHALAAHLLPDVEPLHKVTIIPRGMALGATMQLPERDRYHMSRGQLLSNLVVLYAGRIAEKVFCGDITAGAKNDIERATEIARLMVTEWGMSDSVGPIHYPQVDEPAMPGMDGGARARPHSESTAREIDREVRRIIDECYGRSERLIRDHREETDRIARALLLKETLTGEEVAALVKGEMPDAAMSDGAMPQGGPMGTEGNKGGGFRAQRSDGSSGKRASA